MRPNQGNEKWVEGQEPDTDFGEGGVGTDDASYVGTDAGLVDRRRIMGTGSPDDESDHAGDWTDAAPSAAGTVEGRLGNLPPHSLSDGERDPSGGLMSGGDSMQDDLDPDDVLAASGAPPDDAVVQEQDAREELERDHERKAG